MVRSGVRQSRLACNRQARQKRCNNDRPTLTSVVMVVLLGLSLPCTLPGMVGAEQAGFTQDCSGFAQDQLLGHLWPGKAAAATETSPTTLAAMVPRLSLHGTALATYQAEPLSQTAPTLERVFGVTPGAHRQIVETSFIQESHAVVLHPQVLATVAHALTPNVVEVQASHTSMQTVPLQVTSMTVAAHTATSPAGVLARVVHINEPYDLALVQAEASHLLHPVPFPTVLSYGTGNPDNPVGGLQAGDCVAAIVTWRFADTQDTWANRLVVGKVLAKVPVATNSLTQTKLNVNMFTTDLAVQPGDSGSPVLALQGGKPVLIGLISATMYPTALFTYVSRIDPLLALADALRLSTSSPKASVGVAASPGTPGDKSRTQ